MKFRVFGQSDGPRPSLSAFIALRVYELQGLIGPRFIGVRILWRVNLKNKNEH